MGSLFFQVQEATAAYYSRGGILFLCVLKIWISIRSTNFSSRSALLFSALTAMAEIPALYAQRPVVLKHHRAAMYHPFVEALALTLVDIPIVATTLSIYSIVLYFMVGLQRSAVRIRLYLFPLFMRINHSLGSILVSKLGFQLKRP